MRKMKKNNTLERKTLSTKVLIKIVDELAQRFEDLSTGCLDLMNSLSESELANNNNQLTPSEFADEILKGNEYSTNYIMVKHILVAARNNLIELDEAAIDYLDYAQFKARRSNL